jgi:plastocyanin
MSKFHKFLFVFIFIIAQLITEDSTQAASISGKVKLFSKSADVWKSSANHKNAVIFVNGVGLSSQQNLPDIKVKLVNGQFSHRVLPVQVGQTIIFENTDDIYHNVWSLSKAKNFDLGSFKKPISKKMTFDKPGLVKVFCNIHPEMIMTILVLKNSYFSLSNSKGDFVIPKIPRGKYTLKAWAEGSKPVTKEVDLSKKSKMSLKLKLKQTLLSTHLDKHNKPYKAY